MFLDLVLQSVGNSSLLIFDFMLQLTLEIHNTKCLTKLNEFTVSCVPCFLAVDPHW